MKPNLIRSFFLQDTFIQEVELLREDELANDLLIEGEYLSEQKMIASLGWTQPLVLIRFSDFKIKNQLLQRSLTCIIITYQ